MTARRCVVALLALCAGIAVPVAAAPREGGDTAPLSERASERAAAATRTTTVVVRGERALQRKVRAITSQARRNSGRVRSRTLRRSCTRTARRRGLARQQITIAFRDGARVTVTVRCNGRITTRTRAGRGTTTPAPKPVTVPGPTVTVPGAPAPAPPAPRKALRLTLLHNNDGESKLLTGDSLPGVGGAARYVSRLNQLRQSAAGYSDSAVAAGTKAVGTINVSSGDNFLAGINYQGSLAAGSFYDAFPLNRLGYDAVTLGNHEFDFGPNRLADFIEDTTSAPFVSANLGFDNEPRLKALADQGRIRRSVVTERGGVRIGIIGLTTPTLPQVSTPGQTTIDSNLAGVVNAEAARLTSEGVGVIVLSSHLQGIASERALVPQLRNVDVVIAGGGDELLINAGQRKVTTDPAFAPYPDRSVNDSQGRAVPIVTTQGEYRYVGRLVGEFDADGVLQSVDADSGPVRVVAPGFNEPGTGGSGQPAAVPATDTTDRDGAIVRQVDEPLQRFRQALDSRVIARSDTALDGRNTGGETIRRRETNLGNLVADSFLYAARRDAEARSRPVPDVAITNGGGIRNSSVLRGSNPSGCGPFGTPFTISEGDTFRILAFDNTIVRVGANVTKLKELLEYGYGALGGGRTAQIGGMRVEIDRSQPVGSRIRTVTLRAADGTLGDVLIQNGAPINGARSVVIATTDFLAQRNGDGYPFNLGAGEVTSESLQPSVGYQQALFKYLTEPVANGALGGLETPGATHVTATRYPFGGAPERVVINDGANPDTPYPACP